MLLLADSCLSRAVAQGTNGTPSQSRAGLASRPVSSESRACRREFGQRAVEGPGGVKLPGLVTRRAAEAAMFAAA